MNSSGSTTTRSNASKNVFQEPRVAVSPCRCLPRDHLKRPIDHEIGVGQSTKGVEVEDAKIRSIEGLVRLTRENS
jgi:hypothetical protein